MSSLDGKKNKGAKEMAVLTANCDRTFVVSSQQSKKFLEHKGNNSDNKEILSKIEAKIKVNNDKT